MTREVPEGTWLWLQGFTRWIGTWCFYMGFRLRIWYKDRIPATAPVVVALDSVVVEEPVALDSSGGSLPPLVRCVSPLTENKSKTCSAASRCLIRFVHEITCTAPSGACLF